jgi:hypothetical protein
VVTATLSVSCVDISHGSNRPTGSRCLIRPRAIRLQRSSCRTHLIFAVSSCNSVTIHVVPARRAWFQWATAIFDDTEQSGREADTTPSQLLECNHHVHMHLAGERSMSRVRVRALYDAPVSDSTFKRQRTCCALGPQIPCTQLQALQFACATDLKAPASHAT